MKNKLYLLLLLLSIAVVNSAQAQTKRLSKSEVDAEEAFVNAKILVLNGKDEAAKKAFADLLKKDKTNPDIAYELARIEFLQGDDEMAYRHGQIAAQDQRNSWYQLLFGDILQKLGKLKEAALIYEQLATQHPLVKDYYYNGAECYEKMEDFSKALATYENCEKINGYDIVTTKKKQLIYLKTGKPEAATSELIKLITSNPNNLDYRYYLATLYEKLGKIELARETYAGILKINPNEVRASLAMIDKQPSNGDYNTVLMALKPLFLKKEVSLDLKIKELIPIAQKVADTGDKALANTALEYVKILHTVHPDEAKVYAIEGDFLYYSGNLDAAFSCYQKVLDRNKTIFPVWNQALTILEEQKKYSALLDLAEKALDYFPNQAVVHYYHGIANMQLNKPEDAIVAYKTGLNLTNKNVLLQGDILKKLLQVYLESKKNNEAKALLSKYLPREGEYEASVLEVFGDTFFNLGETENALLYWTKSQQKGNKSTILQKKISEKKI